MNWKSKYGNNHSINTDISLNLCANLTIKCNNCGLWHTAEEEEKIAIDSQDFNLECCSLHSGIYPTSLLGFSN